MTTTTLSRYLIARPTTRPSLKHQLKLAMWQRPRVNLRTGRNLTLWSVLLMVAATMGNSYVAGEQKMRAVLIPETSAAAQIPTPPAIQSLPGGPVGQLLPPGSLAPVGTYANRYAAGNCTWYAASRRQVPSNWGNARTWLPRARAAGWSVGTVPAIGAIAWTAKGPLGHVAVVEAVEGDHVTIAEMNYVGYNKVSRRTVTASSFQYIY